ncbi:uncharacterized protein C11orf98-like [Liolophura sinensis]|uniref:uncharacterized protein C11orf98-like n=1 Tax=Liolophura sinensis TaxID=3198878 RepID=UPI003158DDB6
MGVHQLVSNNRPTRRQKKNYAVAKEKRKVRKAKRGPKKIALEDIHLLSDEQIKRKVAHPNSNITVSGKRRRKMLKRLRHSKREQNKMDGEKEFLVAEIWAAVWGILKGFPIQIYFSF